MVTTPELAILQGERARPPAQWPGTLGAALQRARVGRHSVTTVDAHGLTSTTSYAELAEDTGPIRSALRTAGAAPGDPVILTVRDNRSFLTAFWACVLDGLVPTPIAPPAAARNADAARQLTAVGELFDNPIVIHDEDADHAPLPHWIDLRGLPAPTDTGGDADAIGPGVTRRPDDVALRLLTSGSTGLPKVVPLTHRALAHRAWATARHNGFGPDDIALNWMPLDHVGGLVMWCAQAAFLGCDYIDVDTGLVLADPLTWLDLLSEHRVTMTWAPNFAYALIAAELRRRPARCWDFTALRHLLNGGEAVVGAVAQEFAARLLPFGLSARAVHPSWGMSETGSGVIYSTLDATDDATGMVHLDPASLDGDLAIGTPTRRRSLPLTVTGTPLAGVSVRITGDDGTTLPCGRVGSLEITGDTLFTGYAGNDEANRRAFTTDGWFRTGDCAFVHDGRLTLVGRGTDAIVVNGVNVPVHDIEAALETLPDLRPGHVAVCSTHTRQGERHVVVFVAREHGSTRSTWEIQSDVRAVTGRKFGFVPDAVVERAPQDFPKTAIGKIQRNRLAEQYVSDEDPQSWAYTTVWEEAPLPPAPDPVAHDARLLVFTDATDAANSLPAGALRVSRGKTFRPLTDLRYEIDPDDPASYAALYATLAEHGLSPHTVVYDWLPARSDAASAAPPTAPDLEGGGPASFLTALQATARAPQPPELLLAVTRFACPVDPDEPADPLAATLSGLVRTARLEGLHFDLRQLDFGDEELPTILDAVAAESNGPNHDAVTAYRSRTRYVPRSAPVLLTEPPAPAAVPTGSMVLITGGLGDVGFTLARHLQDQYDVDLVVVGRSPARPDGTGRAATRLTELSARGRVHYVHGDAADEDVLEHAVSRAERQWGSTLGLALHLASQNVAANWRTPEGHLTTNEPVDTFRSVLRSKFLSAGNVTRLAARRPSCTAVLFSSLNGAFGASPFGSYAAACSGVDALAQGPKRDQRVRVLAWSVWAGLGMSRDSADLDEAVRRRGFRTMSPQVACELFDQALATDEPYVMLGLAPRTAIDRGEPGAAGEPGVEAGPHIPPNTPYETQVAQVWAQVLERDVMDVDANFFALGGTSIMAIRVTAQLAEACKAPVRVTELYDCPTVRTLAAAVEAMVTAQDG